MGFLKVEINIPELKGVIDSFKGNRLQALESLHQDFKDSVTNTFNQLLSTEMTLFLGQKDQKDNKRNGYEVKDYTLKGLGTLRIKVPIDRKRRFNSSIVPKGERLDPRIKEDLAALHLAGLSTRTLALMSKRILGVEVSHQTVSRSLPLLADQAQQWLSRPIEGDWWALIVDGTNFKVTRRGSTEKEPMLVVLGIDSNNRRSILAVEPGYRDSADAWKSVFKSLKQRGLDFSKVQVGVMDGLPGLEKVFREEFPKAVTSRCWFHSMQNTLAKVPKRLRDSYHILARKIMYADGEAAARVAFETLERTMGSDCKRAIDCLRKDLDSLLTHFSFPKKLWQALKTTNAVERIHKEFKRRARAMEAMGEVTLTTLIAFTALRLEMGWRQRAVDTFELGHLISKPKKLPIQAALEGENILH